MTNPTQAIRAMFGHPPPVTLPSNSTSVDIDALLDAQGWPEGEFLDRVYACVAAYGEFLREADAATDGAQDEHPYMTAAINRLACLYEYGPEQAAIDPPGLINQACDDIEDQQRLALSLAPPMQEPLSPVESMVLERFDFATTSMGRPDGHMPEQGWVRLRSEGKNWDNVTTWFKRREQG